MVESDRTSLSTHYKIQMNIPKQNNREQTSNHHSNKAKTFIEGSTGGHLSLDESPGHTHWPAVAGRAGDLSHNLIMNTRVLRV